MAGRSPARFLAPIALVAFAFAFYSIVQDRARAVHRQLRLACDARRRPRRRPRQSKKKPAKKRKSYTVKSGDTPSGIAEKTGISLDTLYELNPDLDPQTLAPGQQIRLSE